MFETGMSALVLKICSEYAKSLGLNFPPCTQQEINAICQWVDKHTVKDLTMEQNGDSVTFRFVTENETVKEFTFSIPEQKVDVNVLEQLLIGSETVVVERTQDNSKLQVRLAQSVTDNINSKLAKPVNPTSDSVVTMNASGTVGTKPLSELGGGKLYRHNVNVSYNDGINVYLVFYTTNQTLINTIDKIKANSNDDYVDCVYSGFDGGGSVYFQVNNATTFNLWGAIVARGNPTVVSKAEHGITPTQITDTVTEL